MLQRHHQHTASKEISNPGLFTTSKGCNFLGKSGTFGKNHNEAFKRGKVRSLGESIIMKLIKRSRLRTRFLNYKMYYKMNCNYFIELII